ITALNWAEPLAAFAMYVMMTYLTNVWNLSITHAAGIINVWNGMTPVLAVIFAFFVDEFVGEFNMLVLASISYSIGLGLLSMSTPPVFGPCGDYKKECIGHSQKVLFYTALPLIAVGMAGHLVSLQPFIYSQLELGYEKKLEAKRGSQKEHEAKQRIKEEPQAKQGIEEEPEAKLILKIPGLMMVWVVTIVGAVALPYIRPWSIRFGIPAICTLAATILFLSGFRNYEHKTPPGSPLKTTLTVLVAAARNISRPNPSSQQVNNEEEHHVTSSLSCLNKAAIKLPEEQQTEKWKGCSMRDVEDTKVTIRIVPMWLTFIVIGIVLSIGNTYFLEQANHMDRKLGKIKVSIPIFLLIYNCTSSISAGFYNTLRRLVPNKKYAPPVGIATAMLFSVLCCISAAKVETRRLDRIRNTGLLDKPNERIPMSIFALLPQFMLLAAVDGIGTVSMQRFFKYQSAENMRNYLAYLTKAVLGLGSMASVLSVYIVGNVSERNQKPNWFQFSLNRSRLDRYYWVLAVLSAANLLVYIIVALFYTYKESPDAVQRKIKKSPEEVDEDDEEYEAGGQMDEGFQDDARCCRC
uniref:protein NRT1/ PTR FAMILY 5.5-like n=1 Tax=Erigeron canadensis TaxID=72917 RepID=UPI001CB9070F